VRVYLQLYYSRLKTDVADPGLQFDVDGSGDGCGANRTVLELTVRRTRTCVGAGLLKLLSSSPLTVSAAPLGASALSTWTGTLPGTYL